MTSPALSHEWQHDLTDVPEDEWILLATTGGWVDVAYFVTNEDTGARDWFWSNTTPIHESLMPLAWMPLPKHPGEPPHA